MIELLNIDCMAYMATLPDKSFDLAIVDPPYGIGDFEQGVGKQKKVKKWDIKWNNSIPDKKYFDELFRVSKYHIIWGANYYNYFTTGGAIIWNKNVTHPDMSKAEIASTNLFKKVEIVTFEWNGFIRCEDVKFIHPCQRPVSLHKWLLKNYAKDGYRILDTHLGSGSSAIAAFDGGFDFVGCEIDKDYFDAAKKRFDIHQSQGRLF
jgi:site-specific DNA-methyltransferase (adenine-specific)